MTRSPWTGLTAKQTTALTDAVTTIYRRSMSSADAYDDVFTEFAGRAALLLVANDLYGAIEAAEIAGAARNLRGIRQRPRQVIRGEESVISEDPAPALTTKQARVRYAKAFEGGPPKRLAHHLSGSA